MRIHRRTLRLQHKVRQILSRWRVSAIRTRAARRKAAARRHPRPRRSRRMANQAVRHPTMQKRVPLHPRSLRPPTQQRPLIKTTSPPLKRLKRRRPRRRKKKQQHRRQRPRAPRSPLDAKLFGFETWLAGGYNRQGEWRPVDYAPDLVRLYYESLRGCRQRASAGDLFLKVSTYQDSLDNKLKEFRRDPRPHQRSR